MNVSLDANILLYAEAVNGPEKKLAVDRILAALRRHRICLSVQVLGECFNVLVRKAQWERAQARNAIFLWAELCDVVSTSGPLMAFAMELAVRYRLQTWDAVVLAAAVDARCPLLLSEDFQNGAQLAGVTVVNPFTTPHHPRLRPILEG